MTAPDLRTLRRLDVHAPSLRIVLFAQNPPRYQGVLFVAPMPQAPAPAPCAHLEAGWQRDLFGEVAYCCTFCGAELPEPSC